MTERLEQTEQDPDPQLRMALKRLHGGHVAAPQLRQRIAALLESPPPPTAEDPTTAAPAVAGRIGPAPRTRWSRLIAIAASLAIVVGVASVIIRQHSDGDDQRNTYYVQRNLAVLKAMVATAAAAPSTETPA